MRHINLLPLVALIAAPVLAQGRGALVTYVAGQAAINGQPIAARNANSSTVAVGQMLSTGTGSAELSLTPGAMLRLDSATSIKVVALDEKHTEVQINSGRAEINLSGMHRDGELQVDTPSGVQTLLIQNGLYEFDTKAAQLRVFDGKAAVATSTAPDQWTDVKAGHQLALTASAARPTEFDRNAGDSFAHRSDGDSARGGGYGYEGPVYGFAGVPYGYGVPYAYGFYDPYAFGFYPGFYGGYGFYGGFGYRGGFGYGYGGRGFRR